VIVAKGKRSAPIESLRDTDRELADAAHALGLEVDVVPFVGAAMSARKRARWLDSEEYAQLARPLTDSEARAFKDAFTFADEASSDEAEDLDATTLGNVIADEQAEVCVVSRAAAQSTLLAEGLFSATGYFGNEYYDAVLYAFVALRIRVPSAVARGVAKAPKAAPAPPRARVRHAKFGEGEVLAEEGAGDAATVTVQFAGGTKKLLRRFVTFV
jgi:hypothetical protein